MAHEDDPTRPLKRLRTRTAARTAQAFETRTESWHDAGLGAQVDRGRARRARGRAIVFLLLLAAILVVFVMRKTIFPDDWNHTIRIITALLIAIVGWGLASTLARGLTPLLFRRMEPGVAGTVGFLIRLVTIVLVVITALRIAGVKPETLAVGGAFTAVILGLAAQQTLGNLIAGLVLLSTSPFKVGDRIVLQGGAIAGQVEGVVGGLGLFYTTVVSGADETMVPNLVVMNIAVRPVREPDRVELRARFDTAVTPTTLAERLADGITIPLRHSPDVSLEEIDVDENEVTLNVSATPLNSADGATLASQVLEVIRNQRGTTDEHETVETSVEGNGAGSADRRRSSAQASGDQGSEYSGDGS